MTLQTTTIGAYPKPSYVPVADWFANPAPPEIAAPTAGYAESLAAAGEEAEALFVQATHEAVRDQVEAGIEVPTDGEVRRENYVHYHCRQLHGIDFGQLNEHLMRDSYRALVPTVVGSVRAGAPFLPRDWGIAQQVTDRPVKMTLPGPMTIADSTADRHYGEPARLGADLARALNAEVLALAEAGCTHIQIDEPVFARKVRDALDFGVAHLVRCFDGLPPHVRRIVHICCGYPDRIDHPDYPKASKEVYFELAEALDAAPIDEISLEDAHRLNDLALLLPLFRDTAVTLGVVAIATSEMESADQIRHRLGEALKHIEAERLIAAPDCGLSLLGRPRALEKLRRLAAAARAAG